MCELCANKITILKEIIKKDEEILDVRGKKFLKQTKKLTKLLKYYFEKLSEEMIEEAGKNVMIRKEVQERFADWQDDFNIELQKTYKVGATFQEKVIQTEISIGLSIGISDDLAKAYAQTRMGEFISNIDEDTRTEIRGIINDGMEKQQTLTEVADSIKTKFDQFAEWRAVLIANTEGALAYAHGQNDQFQGYLSEFGAPGWKKTITQGDDKVRESHSDAEALGWVPYKQEYIDSDGQMQISNMFAPFGFRCRCVTSYMLFNPDTNSIR